MSVFLYFLFRVHQVFQDKKWVYLTDLDEYYFRYSKFSNVHVHPQGGAFHLCYKYVQ